MPDEARRRLQQEVMRRTKIAQKYLDANRQLSPVGEAARTAGKQATHVRASRINLLTRALSKNGKVPGGLTALGYVLDLVGKHQAMGAATNRGRLPKRLQGMVQGADRKA